MHEWTNLLRDCKGACTLILGDTFLQWRIQAMQVVSKLHLGSFEGSFFSLEGYLCRLASF